MTTATATAQATSRSARLRDLDERIARRRQALAEHLGAASSAQRLNEIADDLAHHIDHGEATYLQMVLAKLDELCQRYVIRLRAA
jgi:hypothetical protein